MASFYSPRNPLVVWRTSQAFFEGSMSPGDLVFVDCEKLWCTDDKGFLYTGPLIVVKIVPLHIASQFKSIVTLLSSRGVVTVYGSLLDSSRKRAGDL